MKPPDSPEVAAWLVLAGSDLRMAALAFDASPPMWHQVCFHARQSGEKALKAVLEACDRVVPHTHALVLLVDTLMPSLGVPRRTRWRGSDVG